eukprot:SAG22_NODE_15355_length_350_cov_2.258964_1_plen_31_part_01
MGTAAVGRAKELMPTSRLFYLKFHLHLVNNS